MSIAFIPVLRLGRLRPKLIIELTKRKARHWVYLYGKYPTLEIACLTSDQLIRTTCSLVERVDNAQNFPLPKHMP